VETARTIIGLVGHPSCGKDTVAEFLVTQFGFKHISTGDLIREYAKSKVDGELTREKLHVISRQLRAEYGAGTLAEMALKTAGNKLAISGLRTIAEAEKVKQAGGKIVCITAPIKLRYERAKARGRVGEDIDLEKFAEIESRESHSSDPNGQNTEGVIALADYTIQNVGTLAQLHSQVEKIVIQ
jgi:dephospho-CoA kinase